MNKEQIKRDTILIVNTLNKKQTYNIDEFISLFKEYTGSQLPNYHLLPEEHKDIFWKYANTEFKEFLKRMEVY